MEQCLVSVCSRRRWCSHKRCFLSGRWSLLLKNTLVEPAWRLSNIPLKRKAIPPSKMFSKCSPERRVMPPVETSQAPVSTWHLAVRTSGGKHYIPSTQMCQGIPIFSATWWCKSWKETVLCVITAPPEEKAPGRRDAANDEESILQKLVLACKSHRALEELLFLAATEFIFPGGHWPHGPLRHWFSTRRSFIKIRQWWPTWYWSVPIPNGLQDFWSLSTASTTFTFYAAHLVLHFAALWQQLSLSGHQAQSC